MKFGDSPHSRAWHVAPDLCMPSVACNTRDVVYSHLTTFILIHSKLLNDSQLHSNILNIIRVSSNLCRAGSSLCIAIFVRLALFSRLSLNLKPLVRNASTIVWEAFAAPCRSKEEARSCQLWEEWYKYKYSDLFTYIPMSPTLFKATSSIQILASPFM